MSARPDGIEQVIIDGMNTAVLMLDRDLKLLLMNQAAEDLHPGPRPVQAPAAAHGNCDQAEHKKRDYQLVITPHIQGFARAGSNFVGMALRNLGSELSGSIPITES